MNQNNKVATNGLRKTCAWLVHGLTASGAIIGLMTLYFISTNQAVTAFWLMAVTIVIDGVDGSLARLVGVKEILPTIDGVLLDNIVDFLNYVITPCFFLLIYPDILPDNAKWLIVITISICSAYQFCQSDAKTPDHFFKGFPCYWNIVIFYMFLFQSSSITNSIVLIVLCVLIFVPIKYVYPSRLDYLTNSKPLKVTMHLCSIVYGISSGLLLWQYPHLSVIYLSLSLGYVLLYVSLSFLRTLVPLTD